MNKLYFTLILTVFPYFFSISTARGPHHPRGEAIVKRHTHYSPGKNAEKITQDTELLQDKEHIKEHLEEIVPQVDLSKMTEEELELYYFLLHDSDKNSKLDGLELLNAILHTRHEHTHNHDDDDEDVESNDLSMDGNGENDINYQNDVNNDGFNRFVELVDQVLKEDDKNQDGYLDYAEYVKGRKRTERVADKRYSMEMMK